MEEEGGRKRRDGRESDGGAQIEPGSMARQAKCEVESSVYSAIFCCLAHVPFCAESFRTNDTQRYQGAFVYLTPLGVCESLRTETLTEGANGEVRGLFYGIIDIMAVRIAVLSHL